MENRDLLDVKNENSKDDLDGTIHRLGLMAFRLTMIFTVIRNFETGTLGNNLICSDQDFYNALRIIQLSKNNAIAIYTRLPKPKYNENKKDL
jgi:hypothetical protein